MNSNPEIASRWKGRLLIQIDHEEQREARLVREEIDTAKIEKAKEFCKPENHSKYEVCLDIGQGISLPDAKKYKIRMQITHENIKSVEAKNKMEMAKGGYNIWTDR